MTDIDSPEHEPDNLAHPYGIEFHGPTDDPQYRVLRNGQEIPYLALSYEHDGQCVLVLDHRWMITGTDDEVRKWASFLADAMAVSAGYVCFGSDKRINPHNGPTYVRLSS